MNKKHLVVIALLFVLGFFMNYQVSAEELNVKIKEVELVEKSDEAEEISTPTFDNLTLNYNLKFHNLEDSIKYKIVFENNDEETYTIQDIKLDDYLECEIENNVIKANQNTTVYMTIKYKNEVPLEQANKKIESSVVVELVNEDGNIVNPKTMDSIYRLISIFAILIGVTTLSLVLGKKKNKMLLLIISVLLIPQAVYALKELKLTINAKYEIIVKTAELDTGPNINSKLLNTLNTAYDTTIHSIKRKNEIGENLTNDDIISLEESEYPVYMWIEEDTIYFYSEADVIYMNEDSSSMIYNIAGLNNIEGLRQFNTSKVKNLSNYFATYEEHPRSVNPSNQISSFSENEMIKDNEDESIAFDFSPIKDWDTSNVENMSKMFYMAIPSATSFTLDLNNWDTSNVTNMSATFRAIAPNSTSFSLDVSKWDTSNVTDMSHMFQSVGFYADDFFLDLNSWDTSNVINMAEMFANSGYISKSYNLKIDRLNTSKVEDMSEMFYYAGTEATNFNLNLNKWDTSNVNTMLGMFLSAGENAQNFSLTISNWDTSKVTNMSSMFCNAGKSTAVIDLDLRNWNTINVTNMSNMFRYIGSDSQSVNLNLSNWNTSNVTNMNGMFSQVGYHSQTITLDLRNWNTSNVTNMNSMFDSIGNVFATLEIIIPRTNGAGINNTTTRLYGKTTSTYGYLTGPMTFTLAN